MSLNPIFKFCDNNSEGRHDSGARLQVLGEKKSLKKDIVRELGTTAQGRAQGWADDGQALATLQTSPSWSPIEILSDKHQRQLEKGK